MTKWWKVAVVFMASNVATFFLAMTFNSDWAFKIWFVTYPFAFAAAIWTSKKKVKHESIGLWRSSLDQR